MKTAVVTGASYGIGEKIAASLLQAGWKVYGLSRSKPKLDGEHFIWLQCDLSQPEQIETCAAKITEPALDALASNAGVVYVEAASAATKRSFEQTFAVNVRAPMLLVHALKAKIAKATIISVSSDSDRLPNAELALYCSSKAANTVYFNSLALELTEAKIYNLLPDYVDTPMLRRTETDPDFDWQATIDPADIARLVDDLLAAKTKLPSGANIIVVTNALKNSLKSSEQLYGFNTTTSELTKLN